MRRFNVAPTNDGAVVFEDAGERVLDRFLQAFSGDYVQLAMVVNANMELLHAVGETQQYLHFSPGIISTDVSKMVSKELAIPISTGIQKCLKSNEPLIFSNITLRDAPTPLSLQMRIKPLTQKRGQDPLVGIFIAEMKRYAEESSLESRVESYDVSKEAEQRISDLEQELQFTRENLQATVEELETSNEELQATNEELLASNEELQSTNEELQSVNEELFTVNAEYQSKITELTALTNDLDNLLDSTDIATLFLDENMDIRRFSQRAIRIFNMIDSDVGRSILDISNNLDRVDIQKVVDEVVRGERKLEHEVRSGDRWYLMRVVPYRIATEIFSGVVMLFIDITERRMQEGAQNEIASLISGAADAISVQDEAGVIEAWSLGAEMMYGFSRGDAVGKNVNELIPAAKRHENEIFFAEVFKGGRVQSINTQRLNREGEILDICVTGTLLEGDEARQQPTRLITTERNLSMVDGLASAGSRLTNILVVDDDPSLLALFKIHVNGAGLPINVITAEGGVDGLVKIGRYAPSLIFLDLMMPDINGYRLLDIIRRDALLAETPIVICTQADRDDLSIRGKIPENIRILPKPVDFDEILAIVHGRLSELEAVN